MSDAGEGLIDAEARIQERMEELERMRSERSVQDVRNPQQVKTLESLRLARVDLGNQLASTTHEPRRAMLVQAITEIDQRIGAVEASLESTTA